jgi:hypothetical protein
MCPPKSLPSIPTPSEQGTDEFPALFPFLEKSALRDVKCLNAELM